MAAFGDYRYIQLIIACLLACITTVVSHSALTQPRSTSPSTCRMGGEPQYGLEYCPGPCDMRNYRKKGPHGYYKFPGRPTATYVRGQFVNIKYTRNNHGPGGFVRLTLVPVKKMMDRGVHRRNAFHFSCWGANPVLARQNELGYDNNGFTMVGSDGEQHRFGKGYYQVRARIPTVIPDGNYVLGWAWYGGTSSSLGSGTAQQTPSAEGYFGDYYSCSFVRVRGGPFRYFFKPVYINDMPRASSQGCMSTVNHLGPCSNEPCRRRGWYQRPYEFAGGRTPAMLRPHNFK